MMLELLGSLFKLYKDNLVLLLFSIIIGIIVTTYFEDYEIKLLMPIRNLIVIGRLKDSSNEDIFVRYYKHAKGISPVHLILPIRMAVLKILEGKYRDSIDNANDFERILRLANYFIENAEKHYYESLRFYIWSYNFDWPTYNLKAPWVSGMAQGFVIELMLAAYKLTREDKYLETARFAANAMAVPTECGGVAVNVDGGLWFEEYAKPTINPSYVLNGHNFALNGLWHLSQVDNRYYELFKKGVDGLRYLLPYFDAKVWSRYDLTGMLANRKYHKIHIMQLQSLYERTKDKIFKRYAQKFKQQLYLPFTALYRIIMSPNRFLVLLFFVNFALTFVILSILLKGMF